MAEDISLDGKQYVSSKRASELSEYSQDYIGQLARGGHVDAKRVGGMWYVSMDSLTSYQANTEAIRSATEKVTAPASDIESLISFDGKDYISASRASKLTGYNPDYVGQLARAGKVLSRQMGNRWYVDRDGIVAHKQEKDSLLAAVQSESVGIYTSVPAHDYFTAPSIEPREESIFEYSNDEGDLLPQLKVKDSFTFESVPSSGSDAGGDSGTVFDTDSDSDFETNTDSDFETHTEGDADIPVVETRAQQIPIRKISHQSTYRPQRIPSINKHPLYRPDTSGKPAVIKEPARKTMFLGTIAGVALTFVVIVSVGITSFKDDSMYASAAKSIRTPLSVSTFTASAVSAFNKAGDALENLLVTQLHYVRK